MSEIVFEGVTKRFGNAVALDSIDLEIRSDELFVLVGPSGCGKTTLLRVLAGLEAPTEGDVHLDGERVTDVPARKRDLALVFQDFALFPHLSVRENVSFNLRMQGGYDDVDERVEHTADRLDISDLLDRRIDELSGGQKQRVALGRAIVSEPAAFLLDEPFANLDANLREGMRSELARLHDDLDVTTVHVTHDQREALSIGDRIAVLRRGTVQQVGTPEEVYRRPETLFVARFVGSPTMNLLRGRYDESASGFRVGSDGEETMALPDTPALRDGTPLPDGRSLRDGTSLVVGIRPEHVRVAPGDSDRPSERAAGEGNEMEDKAYEMEKKSQEVVKDPHAIAEEGDGVTDEGHETADCTRLRATVDLVEFQGADQFVHLVTDAGFEIVGRAAGDADFEAGETVTVELPPNRVHLFDPDSGRRLRESSPSGAGESSPSGTGESSPPGAVTGDGETGELDEDARTDSPTTDAIEDPSTDP